MVDVLSRRPGFTTGVEEELWRGSPALRSTFYFWGLSLVAGWVVNLFWMKLLTGLFTAGYLGALGPLLFSPRGPQIWTVAAPWGFILYPVFVYTLRLMVTSYRLTTQRLSVRSGIFLRTYDQVELFRVRDFIVDTPIYLAILGIGHVRVLSRDESLPMLTLIAQVHADSLVDMIRDYSQRRKDEVGMRELETNNHAM